MSTNPYESASAVEQYLLFHYGTAQQQCTWPEAPQNGFGFPARCVWECLDLARLSSRERALDLGCSVGRSSFELAQTFSEVLAVDFSEAFIQAAQTVQKQGSIHCAIHLEGNLQEKVQLVLDPELPRERVGFIQGDALQPKAEWGTFDCVLAANLIDRVSDPVRLLAVLKQLTRARGQLILVSPYTWMEQFTPGERWPKGVTFEFISAHLSGDFELVRQRQIPFLLREHARKFQWSVAEATVWQKKG